jgi:glycosyltransferase involved in cell wall biosynthesis
MITVYSLAFNEEAIMKFMIDHYRTRFPGCRIVIHDNYSTDNTVDIALANGVEVVYYDTNGKLDDHHYIGIKNECWKSSKTDWVVVCDMDELLEINEEQLKAEEALGTTMIRAEGYSMINMEDNMEFAGIKYGARSTPYDKSYMFNKKYISQIDYVHGCHRCSPLGTVKNSSKAYVAYHFKNINADALVARYKLYASRLSDLNLKRGHGGHYKNTEEQIRGDFRNARLDPNLIKLID